MSIVTNAKHKLHQEVARASRNEVYGLHYKIDWLSLINTKMIMKALSYDDILSIYSTSEREEMESKLINHITANCGCS